MLEFAKLWFWKIVKRPKIYLPIAALAVAGELAKDYIVGKINEFIEIHKGIVVGIFQFLVERQEWYLWYLIPLVVLLFILITGLEASREINLGKLHIRFCDKRGRFVKNAPVARYFQVGTGQISYLVGGCFKLSNRGKLARTIEESYVLVSAKGKELGRKDLENVPNRIEGKDTLRDTIEFHTQFLIEQMELNDLVGVDYKKAKVELVIQAVDATGKFAFRNDRGYPGTI